MRLYQFTGKGHSKYGVGMCGLFLWENLKHHNSSVLRSIYFHILTAQNHNVPYNACGRGDLAGSSSQLLKTRDLRPRLEHLFTQVSPQLPTAIHTEFELKLRFLIVA